MKEQAQMITTILIVLLVLASIIIVWHVVDYSFRDIEIVKQGQAYGEATYVKTVVNPNWIKECLVEFDLIANLPNDYGSSKNFSVYRDGEYLLGKMTVNSVQDGGAILLEAITNSSEIEYLTIGDKRIDVERCRNMSKIADVIFTRHRFEMNESWLNNNALCKEFCDTNNLNQEECWISYNKAFEDYWRHPTFNNCTEWYLGDYLIRWD